MFCLIDLPGKPHPVFFLTLARTMVNSDREGLALAFMPFSKLVNVR